MLADGTTSRRPEVNRSARSEATTFAIGDAAREVDVPTHVLRHWEDVGLLTPTRDRAGRRQFDAEQVLRARLILTCQGLGFSLADIRMLFLADDPAVRLGRIRRHQQQLETQRRRLEQLTGFLDHVLVCPHSALTDCTTCTAILEIRPEAKKNQLRQNMVRRNR